VPKIRDGFLNAVAFLYFSRSDADWGAKAGGSGFIVGIPTASRSLVHLYVITNRHVVEGGCSTIRLTSLDGSLAVIKESDDAWTFPAGEDDIAAWYMGAQKPGADEFSYVLLNYYAVDETHDYGPGDDCFMLGRFVTKDGLLRNEPSARFGNVSMLPREQIERRRDVWVDAFLVETRSQVGYSGSPVFVYRREVLVEMPIRDSSEYKRSVRAIDLKGRDEFEIKLLGVDFGHLPTIVGLGQATDSGFVDEHPLLRDGRVSLPSGMIAVVPAWKLVEMLHRDDVVAERDAYAADGEAGLKPG
jgi:hypothetical protein